VRRVPFDPYVIIHAPFVSGRMRTAAKRKTWEPKWLDTINLKSLIIDPNHLQARYLIAEIWDNEEDNLIGTTVS